VSLYYIASRKDILVLCCSFRTVHDFVLNCFKRISLLSTFWLQIKCLYYLHVKCNAVSRPACILFQHAGWPTKGSTQGTCMCTSYFTAAPLGVGIYILRSSKVTKLKASTSLVPHHSLR